MNRTTLALLLLTAGLAAPGPAAEPDSARARLAEAARSIQETTARQPFPFRDVGVFDVVSPKTIAGTGFLVRADGKTYAVTARHPHPDQLPTRFQRGDQSVQLGRLVRDADDVLCFAMEDSQLPTFTLIRPDGVYLRKGEAVTVIGHDARHAGRLNGIGLGMDEWLLPGEPVTGTIGFTVPGEPDFKGNSGAPVVLDKTGEVLGVLLKAVGVGRETMLEFAPLSFGAPLVPAPLRTPRTVFSIASRPNVSPVVETNAAAAFPAGLLEISPGTPLEQLRSARAFLAGKPQPNLYGQAYTEWLGKRNGSEYLFHEATFVVSRGMVNRLEMLGYGWSTNVPAARLEALFDWFLETLGPPARAVEFTTKDGRPGYGGLHCTWTNATASVSLGLQATGKQYNPKPWLSLELNVRPPATGSLLPPKATQLSTDLPGLRRELRRFLHDTAELPAGPR